MKLADPIPCYELWDEGDGLRFVLITSDNAIRCRGLTEKHELNYEVSGFKVFTNLAG